MVWQQYCHDYNLTDIKHYEESKKFTETCRVFHCNRRWNYSNDNLMKKIFNIIICNNSKSKIHNIHK